MSNNYHTHRDNPTYVHIANNPHIRAANKSNPNGSVYFENARPETVLTDAEIAAFALAAYLKIAPTANLSNRGNVEHAIKHGTRELIRAFLAGLRKRKTPENALRIVETFTPLRRWKATPKPQPKPATAAPNVNAEPVAPPKIDD